MPTTRRARTRHSAGLPLLVILAIALALLGARNGDLPVPDPTRWPPWPATDSAPTLDDTTLGGGGTAGGGTGGGVELGRVVHPLPGGRVTSGFGWRAGGMHYGLDIAAPIGTPIRALADATVLDAGPATGFGLWVRLRHHDGTVSVYGHMNTITTPTGAAVTAGQQIATVGDRGQSTGPHLHLEIWPDGQRAHRVDPATWLARHGARDQ